MLIAMKGVHSTTKQNKMKDSLSEARTSLHRNLIPWFTKENLFGYLGVGRSRNVSGTNESSLHKLTRGFSDGCWMVLLWWLLLMIIIFLLSMSGTLFLLHCCSDTSEDVFFSVTRRRESSLLWSSPTMKLFIQIVVVVLRWRLLDSGKTFVLIIIQNVKDISACDASHKYVPPLIFLYNSKKTATLLLPSKDQNYTGKEGLSL